MNLIKGRSIRSLLIIGACSVAVMSATVWAVGGLAAQQGSATDHGGVITTGSPNVNISESPAARLGDSVFCPHYTGPIPHGAGTIITGSATVMINGAPAAVTGSVVSESGGAYTSTVTTGSPTVVIGN